MPSVSKRRIETVLTDRLGLTEPKFALERIGTKLSGSIISASFRRKPDIQRQQMIWDALEAELGGQATRSVGTLLAYTPEEWNLDVEAPIR